MEKKSYERYCELCEYRCCDPSNWSKHRRTAKHLSKVKDKEALDLRVQLELAKLQLQQGGNATGITMNIQNTVINDNSRNVFMFNTPSRKNFSDLFEEDLNFAQVEIVSTNRYGEHDYGFSPIAQIQKRLLALPPPKRPIIIKASKTLVKECEIQYEGEEAEKLIGLIIQKEFNRQYFENYADEDGAPLWRSQEEFAIFKATAYQNPAEMKDTLFKKIYSKLQYKQEHYIDKVS